MHSNNNSNNNESAAYHHDLLQSHIDIDIGQQLLDPLQLLHQDVMMNGDDVTLLNDLISTDSSEQRHPLDDMLQSGLSMSRNHASDLYANVSRSTDPHLNIMTNNEEDQSSADTLANDAVFDAFMSPYLDLGNLGMDEVHLYLYYFFIIFCIFLTDILRRICS